MANLLVIDDDKHVAGTVRLILTKKGHQVQEANDGAMALRVLGIEPPKPGIPSQDLIVLDLTLPDTDGYKLAQRLYDHIPTRRIPLIILSGKGQALELSEMLPNVKAYIEKPYEPAYLVQLISDVLRGEPK